MPKISKGHNSVKILRNLFKVNQVIYFKDPVSIPNIKALAQLVFNISCLQSKNVENFKGS